MMCSPEHPISYLCISPIEFPGPLPPPLHSPLASLLQHFSWLSHASLLLSCAPDDYKSASSSTAPTLTLINPEEIQRPSLVMKKKVKKTTELFYTQSNANQLSLVLIMPFETLIHLNLIAYHSPQMRFQTFGFHIPIQSPSSLSQ